MKSNSQPDVTLPERRDKNPKIRRELSYPLDNRRSILQEEKVLVNSVSESVRKNKSKSIKKRKERLDTLEKGSNIKRTGKEKENEKRKEITEVWFKVIGRKERKHNVREEKNKKINKELVKKTVKKRKLFKISAVVITAKDNND